MSYPSPGHIGQCRVKLLDDRAKLPSKAYPTDTGFDLHAIQEDHLLPNETAVIPTGIAIELPAGFGAEVRPRSSQSKRGILVSLGTVDNSYRGPIGVTITNLSEDVYVIEPGERIAQLCIVAVPHFEIVQYSDLSKTDRGWKGFGSTGR